VPYRIVVWQLAAAATLATGLFLWEFPGRSLEAPMLGFDQTVSALAAGMASALPAGLYAWRASVERSATGFLLQGVVKFALTLLLMAACIIVLRPAPAAFFGTLMLTQAMYVAAPLWSDRSARKAESRAEIRRR
jgi:F0F1-type ATP synthase assembly protein I